MVIGVGETGDTMRGVIAADLARGNWWVAREAQRSGLNRRVTSRHELKGEVQLFGSGKYEVRYQLRDPDGQTISGEVYRCEARQLRDVAHAISDAVYEQVTGRRGVFSTRLLYIAYKEHQQWPYSLIYSDADGARTQMVLRSKERLSSPSWSPDGKKIAYISYERAAKPRVYIHELAGAERRELPDFEGLSGGLDWSPDGQKLAFVASLEANKDIYVFNIVSGDIERKTTNSAEDTEPRWLPDGQSLVFTSSRGGGPQIYKLDLRDNSVRRVSFEGDYNARPDVTPDGRYLTYVHRRNGKFHIAVQDLKRGTFDIVTQTEMDESPSVAPNGSMIIYATQFGGSGVLEAVSIDGRIKVHLPSKEGEVREPAWSPFL